MIALVGWIAALIGVCGAAFALASARWAGAYISGQLREAVNAPTAPGVTILKPLHGAEQGLRANLQSFCEQDYRGPVQIVFGVHGPDDGAIAVVRELQRANPHMDIDLVVDGRIHGENRKVSNLINMARAMRHDIVVLSDSDIRVGHDYLERVVERLARPGVGFVTCLYTGSDTGSVWSVLAAMGINYQFLPNVTAGLRLKMAEPCFGATVAFRRQVLEAIGGFDVLSDQLADDYDLGRDSPRRLSRRCGGGRRVAPVRRAGLRPAVAARGALGPHHPHDRSGRLPRPGDHLHHALGADRLRADRLPACRRRGRVAHCGVAAVRRIPCRSCNGSACQSALAAPIARHIFIRRISERVFW